MWYDSSLHVRAVNEKKVMCEVYCLHVVKDVSKYLDILDILTLEALVILKRPPILLQCKRILHQLLVHHSLVGLQ